MISALEHFSYCPRQCALIHLEQTFDDNVFTARGHLAHERIDAGEPSQGQDVRIERGVALWSRRLGLVGRADVVEFHDRFAYPVEYKTGPRRSWGHEALQVCAQAMCLEEMLGTPLPRGAIYYHGSRRRREVIFDEHLRKAVEDTIHEIRKMLERMELPPPVNDSRCRHCSLIETCMPSIIDDRGRQGQVAYSLFQASDM